MKTHKILITIESPNNSKYAITKEELFLIQKGIASYMKNRTIRHAKIISKAGILSV